MKTDCREARDCAPCVRQRDAIPILPLGISGMLASWHWIVFGLLSSIPGRPECLRSMESVEGLQDGCLFLMVMMEVIISAHFKDGVGLAEMI